ncbi:hypothetical protein AQUCO_00900552v1 [Aquilegia coerulea]|uniref:FAR1 domain-containing protein n=1 Tax=Aquilegia coerulea TaxID=218851 RepID=A0A2G5EE85_AQUCA|nr:hypothetical protein AQUCO_00900552v1 [Aquilegia coerulea]
MAEEEEVVNAFNITPLQQCSSSFLEVNCKSSGKVRRFSVGTEASFALQLINQKLVSVDPLASYIEAFKEGEEPISFGPNSLLIDYGDGWKLQTVTNEGFEKQNDMDLQYEDFPNIIEPRKGNVEFATDYDFQLEDSLQVVENPIASEPVSDIDLQSEKLDLTDTFKTDVVFDSRDELVKWARDVGRSVGTVIVKKKSDFGVGGRTPRLAIGCERGGKYRIHRKGATTNKLPVRRSGTKKCECPFSLKGIKMPKDDQWKVIVECGFHNHPLGIHSEGHSYAGKLTPEEEALVKEMSKSGVKPKEVLNILKERDMHNATKMNTIYNVRQKLKLAKKSRRSQCNSL